ncbi:MAG: type II toxin-antitoxin system HicB family antitoxin [Bacteroides sp.]|nr:type II toxin-antitoxin system HicB family antitoxin [Eubacterium sp.]MCM1418269.1 type II toxin-antitoxin system HicB family antitoxin [Roseburia sp.]MCM1462348.1 type II toxin-antitoxin system HicB family antitoxin [Bacteroides sp.]
MKDMMEYKGYFGTVEYSEPDRILFGKVIGIDSLISYEGKSVDALRGDFETSVDDYLELCAERSIEPDKPYKGNFNVRISPALHRELALYSAAHNQSLNASVEKAIESYISPRA